MFLPGLCNKPPTSAVPLRRCFVEELQLLELRSCNRGAVHEWPRARIELFSDVAVEVSGVFSSMAWCSPECNDPQSTTGGHELALSGAVSLDAKSEVPAASDNALGRAQDRTAPEPDFGILALQEAGPCEPRLHADLYSDAAAQRRPPEHGTPKRSKVSTPVSALCTEIVISGYRGGIRRGRLDSAAARTGS